MKIRRQLALALMGLLVIVPALPAEAPRLSVYGALPGFERAALSSSGGRTAIIGEINGVRRLLVIDAESKPLLSVEVGDAKIRGLYWAGEETLLLYKSDTSVLSPLDFTTDKTELFSMLVLPLDGGEAWSVFADSASITGGVRGFYGIRLMDGEYFGYFGGMTYEKSSSGRYLDNTEPVLYEVDLRTRKSRRIAPAYERRGFRDWIIGSDGAVGATLDFSSTEGDWVIRNRDGRRIASGTNATGDIGLIGPGTAPDTLIYAEKDDEGQDHWIELPLGGGEERELFPDAAIRSAIFDERTRQFAGYEEDGDQPTYRMIQPQWQNRINATLRAFPGKIVRLRDWNEQFTMLVVTTEGKGDPGTWWRVDLRTGKAVDIGLSYTLRPDQVGDVSMVRYKASDGLEIAAVLTLPPGSSGENLPLVVMPHGGPAARDYPGFDWWAQALASRGYAVLQPNFRGSTGYGADFQRAGHGEWGLRMQSDLSDGVAFLAAQGIADPRRVCIVGASYGGYAALAGVTLQRGIYRCAVSVAGIGDLAKMVSSDVRRSGSDAALSRALKKEVGSGRDLRAVSPVRFAEAADAPILLVHGKDDVVVEHAQSADMARALQRAGKPVELLTLNGEDHWLSRSETRTAMLEAVVRFVEEHNPAGSAR